MGGVCCNPQVHEGQEAVFDNLQLLITVIPEQEGEEIGGGPHEPDENFARPCS
jgi:hypothetical protein